jgi:alkylhydroperoxidase family enzyme
MPWIKTVPYDEASGILKQEYDGALKRAGRIYNIVSLQSLRPRALRASIRLYGELMHAPSSLSRVQREAIATVVSRTLGCHY